VVPSSEQEPPELPGWDVSVGPAGPDAEWWCALVSSSTDKRTHRPPSSARTLPADRPPQLTTTRYTLRSVAVPGAPEPGTGLLGDPPGRRCEIVLTWSTGDDEPRAAPDLGSPHRVTFRLDGEHFVATVQRDAELVARATPTWRATGALALPNGPSKGRPVTFEVAAYDVPNLLPEWTTVPVATLLLHRDVWLAP